MAINLGSTAIADAKLGTTQVEKIYLGSEQIWGGSPTPTEPQYGEVVLYGYTVTQTVIDNVSGGTISVVDEDYLAQALYGASYPITVTVTGTDPADFYSWEVTVSQPGMYVEPWFLGEAISINPNYLPFTVSFTVESVGEIVIDKSTTNTTTLASASQFNAYCDPSRTDSKVLDNNIPKGAVKELRVGSDITSIPSNFLKGCNNLDTFAFAENNNVSSIGSGFLSYCTSFDSAVTLPSSLTSISDKFLNGCSLFNQQVSIPSTVTSIGDDFMDNCSKFNQPIALPSNLQTIGARFLYTCSVFNQEITIPSSVTSIGALFLGYCKQFNYPITIPSSITVIPGQFLSGCSAFNSSITLPNTATGIGSGFLSFAYAFNQAFTIPSTVTAIGDSFLEQANNFNQVITLPSGLLTIGNRFLTGASRYSQNITLPSTLTSVGTHILNNASEFKKTINISSLAATVFATSNYTLSCANSSVAMYTTGVTIKGTNRSAFMSRFPNRTSSPYRKLKDGGA